MQPGLPACVADASVVAGPMEAALCKRGLAHSDEIGALRPLLQRT